jgi:hypothetical protein
VPSKRTVFIILSVAIAAMLVATGILLLYKDSMTRQGFSQSGLKVPEIVYDASIKTWIPTPATNSEPLRSLSMTWTMSPVYADYGGTTELTVTNEGATTVHISGDGVEWPSYAVTTFRNENINVTAGGTVSLGLLFFKAPNMTGDASYRINLKISVRTLSGTAWHDYGTVNGTMKSATIIPSLTYRNYTVTSNTARYFDKINSLVDVDAVNSLAASLQGGAAYNIQQVCAAYDWVHENIQYLDDPTDIWQSTSETLALKTGDCEDQAILVASIITAMGGTARVNLVEDHAFPTVFVGSDPIALFSIDGAVESHYGTFLQIYFLQDSAGYWMILDTTGFPYAGGIPTTAGPVLVGDNAWSFESTDYLIAIDVKP